MQTYKTKSDIIEAFRISDKDTGSVELQVALITDRIIKLTSHFKTHPKDFGSKRGLLMLVGQRRRFLSYIESHSVTKYKKLIESLGLRK